jgi:hypothetical protein
MILIPTTMTAIQKLKRQAKDLKKRENIVYSKALEIVAREAGYESWHHVNWCYTQSSAEKNKL